MKDSLSQMVGQQVSDFDVLISEAQLRQRLIEMGHQISADYQDKGVFCVGVLENGFIFMADLVRHLTCNVLCQFVRPYVHELVGNNTPTTEIFYAPELDMRDHHVLLCEGILSTGQTTEFLVRNFLGRGAASVDICALLDRPSDRRISLEVKYLGFQIEREWVGGFGLGTPILNRNLPYIFATPDKTGK